MSGHESAGSMSSGEPHRYWDKMVSAAYLRMLGATQEEAAEAVGRAERTIHGWEKDERWSLAREEAKERWLSGLADKARARALELIEETDDLGDVLKVLERLDERLLPPKQRMELTGEDGGPVEHSIDRPMSREQKAAEVEELLAEVKARDRAAKGNGGSR